MKRGRIIIPITVLLVIVGVWAGAWIVRARSARPLRKHVFAPARSAASAATAAASAPASQSKPVTRPEVAELSEILASRNDNDPRLDRDFNALSEPAKAAFRELYAKLDPEKRNSRGMVVFLLSRNLSTSEDFSFLSRVLDEAPCLSLANCSAAPEGGGDGHFAEGNALTLVYPQLMALKAIEEYLRANPQGDLAPLAWDSLRAGESSPSDAVARMARESEARLRAKAGAS